MRIIEMCRLFFFLYVGFSEAFTIKNRWGFSTVAPLSLSRPSLSNRGTSSLALYFQRANNTLILKDFEMETKDISLSRFSPPITKELSSDLHQLYGQASVQHREYAMLIPNDLAVDKTQQEGISDVWKARLLLIGASALYGTNFSLVKLMGDTMPVGVSSTLRFGLAALVTLPWLVKDISKEGRLMAAWLGFEIGLWNSIGYVAQAVGLESTPASESAFICALAVVTVPLLDFAAGKRLLPRQWVGAILAVIGVAFLELGGEMAASSITTGDMLSLVQPFAFGIGFWRMEQAMHRFPEEAARLTAAQLLAVFCASATYGLSAIDLPTLQSYPWTEWLTSGPIILSLFWTGCITTALTIYMENLALETLSAAETTLIFSTEPLWGTAFAAVVMNEQLGCNAAVGAFCILAACVYSNLGWQGITSLVNKGVPGLKGTRIPLSARELPVAFQKQWTWFSTSVATSCASLSVAAKTIPEQLAGDLNDTFEEMIAAITESIP